ncbi:hypothetical protein [Streptomyces sp. TS71-3]|uniref:hypothetical protein n=1 Tax=Streptomyces sp. TS71-3 TaxID=2733862 RepID=UPI001B1F1F42|nr:hypothetical protein [Streptomyces sp. TS71-3]GHJ37307.1 hypothetical protein Sm713_29160 [Streptomyces sp. TS71-3]
MHHHGYLWTGPKNRFDNEALRRPPHPEPPPAGAKPELIQRYREVAEEFPTPDLPPLETAYWLIKPRSLVRATSDDAKQAASWLHERLAEYAPRFASERDRDTSRLARLASAAAERLHSCADVSYGFYLERPTYLSLAMVTCSPNHSQPELPCPVA